MAGTRRREALGWGTYSLIVLALAGGVDAAVQQDRGRAEMGVSVTSEGTVMRSSRRLMRVEHQEPVIDCQWHEWSFWSYCTATCGEGQRSRKRWIFTPEQNGGKPCEGGSESFETCQNPECGQDCEWAEWGDWNRCSASCDGGRRQRNRPIEMVNNSLGKPCNPGENAQEEQCSVEPCGADCQWAEWSTWGACSESCGSGKRWRERAVAQAAAGLGKRCVGERSEEEPCNEQACSQDCSLTPWTQWAACSLTCGAGITHRERSVVSPPGDGGFCSTELSQESPCYLAACPGNCVWGDWSAWDACSVSCGGTTHKIRSLRVKIHEEDPGGYCEGKPYREQPCGHAACPVDCEMTMWSEWAACTASCGGGSSQRWRAKAADAYNGGRNCSDEWEQSQPCNEQKCLGCELSDWSDWSYCGPCPNVSQATRSREPNAPGQHCAETLLEERPCCNSDASPASNQTQQPTTQKMTTTPPWTMEEPAMDFGPEPAAEQTSTTQAVPVDCAWSPWHAWEPCSKSCEGGITRRDRYVATPAIEDGKDCIGDVQQTGFCNEKPCVDDCKLSDWSAWSSCNCQTASRSRTRQLLESGKVCEASLQDATVCRCPMPVQGAVSDAVPNHRHSETDRNCLWGAWSPWESCSQPCGVGVTHRFREIALNRTGRGEDCFGNVKETRSCNLKPCCVSDWSAWSHCASPCSIASMVVRTRTLLPGAHCHDVLEQERLCCTAAAARTTKLPIPIPEADGVILPQEARSTQLEIVDAVPRRLATSTAKPASSSFAEREQDPFKINVSVAM